MNVAKYEILTLGGKIINFERCDPEQITLEDIAHGLSNVCRFSGQLYKFYSVAQHCLHVCRHMPDHLKLDALFHDASEAYMGDVPRPVKLLCPDYKKIEAEISEAIRLRFGLSELSEVDERVLKGADSRCLLTEAQQLKLGNVHWLDVPYEPFEESIVPMTPDEARAAYLAVARALGV